MERRKRKLALGVAAIVAIGLIWTFRPFAVVPAGYRGVMTMFGRPSPTVYAEGIHWRTPIAESLNLVNVSTLKSEVDGEAASRDLQSVQMRVALNYHANSESAVAIFRDLGNEPEIRIVAPAIQESMKAVVARYTAEELITKRADVSAGIVTQLRNRMLRHGLAVDEFSLINFRFSRSFDDAIEAKTTAEQLKLKADRDLERVRVEAEQRLTMAQAEAASLRAQKEQITPELLKLREVENQREAIKRWNGVLPQYSGQAAVPFLQIR
ncbi:hypothetical protein LMG23992_02236 [Cupriavidus laharis]|uniref:Band 7 domain-containing protein n=1 Tax=Cupriavidus laharis TaxID=151654 RepID=A0ABM8WY27_9BURK|nr:prohibitin family protein [Cupriavidus laharis]CAG9172448.1 hypothetical protein LMG23992_02236 [Cupriavidus laharis]